SGDWSSDVCSSDLQWRAGYPGPQYLRRPVWPRPRGETRTETGPCDERILFVRCRDRRNASASCEVTGCLARTLRCDDGYASLRPNKRLKLTSGDRFKGIGALCPGGHGRTSTSLAPAGESPAA